ncbi:hypothetical protein [Pseudomonas mucidolens]|uniref:hypothetical protein n=1 Tax=Pseudomonas mucidolens TaxID=46679 RepID=UPI0030D73226
MHSTSIDSRNRYPDSFSSSSLENVADKAYGEGYQHGQQDARGAGRYLQATDARPQGSHFSGAHSASGGFDYQLPQVPQMRNFTGPGAFQAPSTHDFLNGMQSQAQATSPSNPIMQMFNSLISLLNMLKSQLFGAGPEQGQVTQPCPGHTHPQPTHPWHPGHGQAGSFPPGHHHPAPGHGRPPRNEFSGQSDASLAQALQNSFGSFEDPRKPGYISEKSLKAVADRAYPSGDFSKDRDTLLAREYLMRPALLGLSDKHASTGQYDGLIDRKNLQIAAGVAQGNSNPYYGDRT